MAWALWFLFIHALLIASGRLCLYRDAVSPLRLLTVHSKAFLITHIKSTFERTSLHPSKSRKPIDISGYYSPKPIRSNHYHICIRHGGRQPVPICSLNGSSHPHRCPLQPQLLPTLLSNAVHTHLVPHSPHDRMRLCVKTSDPKSLNSDTSLTMPKSRSSATSATSSSPTKPQTGTSAPTSFSLSSSSSLQRSSQPVSTCRSAA